jgi:hypothetical protein
MFVRQKCIGSPKTRTFRLAADKCAANDNPYGPAPTIATSVIVLKRILLLIGLRTWAASLASDHGAGATFGPASSRLQKYRHLLSKPFVYDYATAFAISGRSGDLPNTFP